ncbi:MULTISPECIES: hypothetical protein [Glycomyces]|uniref:Uncharacterized protein n=2 Tax=Glycomyces TaxID=58113 RepID=A0ABU2AIJ5_9ACTN|nr:hypothetical protein [Glycomyces lechevalierae]MDR7336800.1 hypothetical protein [Glycomyces lechevalierae]
MSTNYKFHLEPSIDSNGALRMPAVGGDTAVSLTRFRSGALYLQLASTGDLMVAELSDEDALKLAEQLRQIAGGSR